MVGKSLRDESFDVTSLYTDVFKVNAMQAVYEMLVEHQDHITLYGLSIAQLMTLVDECLQCNILKWAMEYYRQGGACHGATFGSGGSVYAYV